MTARAYVARHLGRAKFVSLYDNLGATKVTDHGACVQSVYNSKPWRDTNE